MAIISGSSAEGGKPWGEGNARPPGGEHQTPAGDVIPTLRRLDAALKGWERSEGDGGGREESPDPERIRLKSIFRQRVSSPRVRVVCCREENPKNRTLSDLTKTETVSVSPVKATPRSALGSGELWFDRRASKQRQKR